MHTYYVYLLTNANHTVIYTGVTNNLERRVAEHKADIHEGFTKKYNVHKLVFFETNDRLLFPHRGDDIHQPILAHHDGDARVVGTLHVAQG